MGEREELKASSERGFYSDWRVDYKYQIDSGIVRSIRHYEDFVSWREPKYYYPMARPEIVGEFAKLVSEEQVLRFVHRYGLLGYREVAVASRDKPLADLLNRAADEQTGDFIQIHRLTIECYKDKAFGFGDPVDWILGHAANVRFVLQLTEWMKSEYVLKREIDRLKDPEPEIDFDGKQETRSYVVRFKLFAGEQKKANTAICTYFPDARDTVSKIVQIILVNNLYEGVSRSTVADPPATTLQSNNSAKLRLHNSFSFKSLLDCIYWLLADAVLDQEAIKKCMYCGKPFIATHGKMKFCPPPRGYQGISPCANRHRVRQCRERRKNLAHAPH